jgi:hypothetical protein
MFSLSSKKITQLAFAICLLAIASISVSAQKKKSTAHSEPNKPVIISEANSPSANDDNKSVASTKPSNIFVQSLRDQLVVREREVAVAKENLEKTKQLFADGILSKRAVEEAEVTLVEAQTKADDIRRKLASYENKTTETAKVETETKQDDIVVTVSEKQSPVKRTTQTRAKVPTKKPLTKKSKRP